MECRSTERRRWIVDNYNVMPIAHIQLLSGQIKRSDACATIENDYYIFYAIDKRNGHIETIRCGMGAARDLLRFIGHKGLPLFNPLHGEEIIDGRGGENLNRNGVRIPVDVWNPIARQLFNAIMWIIIIIDAKLNTTIFNIKEKVYRFKDKEPFP